MSGYNDLMTSREQVLLTGSTGFLGQYLLQELRARDLKVITGGRRDCDVFLDLGDPGSIQRTLAEVAPTSVLNAGAMSSISECERHPERALRVNSGAVEVMAHHRGVRLLQVSTDLVFDGRKAPYQPADEVCGLSEYGRSKAAAEPCVVDKGGVVARLALLFGKSFNGQAGATDWLRSAVARGDRQVLFTNEFRTPVHVQDVARGLVDLLLSRDRVGIVHFAGTERVSRADLAHRFLAAAGLSSGLFDEAETQDPQRPRDVSLVSEWAPGRDLEEAFRAS